MGNLGSNHVLIGRIKVIHILILGAGMHLALVAECLSSIIHATD